MTFRKSNFDITKQALDSNPCRNRKRSRSRDTRGRSVERDAVR